MPPEELLAQPIILSCGLTLPNRLVDVPCKRPSQLPAILPLYNPPMDKYRNLYNQRANAKYRLMITGQVQIEIRYLSIRGDVSALTIL